MRRGILITARLKSTRLKEKVCKHLGGKPLISHLIDRMKRCHGFDEIILCTSPLEQDEPLVRIAEQEAIKCYMGHPDDVLLRLTIAAQKFNLDTVINVTGDNPLIEVSILEQLASYHEKNKFDFTKVEGIPIGTYGWGLSRIAMEKALDIKDKSDTEWWAEYFLETTLFDCGVLKIDDPALMMDVRLTVDTPADFKLVEKIFSAFNHQTSEMNLGNILMYLKANPSIVRINKEVQHKKPTPIKLKAKYEQYRI